MFSISISKAELAEKFALGKWIKLRFKSFDSTERIDMLHVV